jgi:hypothetical protein
MSLVSTPQNASVLIGLLVEKLGGVVTFTKDEMKKSLVFNGGTVFVQVEPEQMTIEVFPQGFNNGAH